MPHQNLVPTLVGTPGVNVPIAGVLNPHKKRIPVGNVGGAVVGAAEVDPQMMNPGLVTLASENHAIEVPALTARLLI
jgi:hypothetical protein